MRILSCAGKIVPVLALLFSSCVLAGFVRFPRRVPFDESKLAAYRGSGSGSLIGQLICTDEGVDHPGEGTPVTLVPVTAYTREMVERELGDGVYLTPSDARFKKYVRLTRTDDHGNFSIQQLPAGEYFVAGEASWAEAGSSDTFVHQWACERVSIGKGQAVRIEVTHNPQHGNSPVQNIWKLE